MESVPTFEQPFGMVAAGCPLRVPGQLNSPETPTLRSLVRMELALQFPRPVTSSDSKTIRLDALSYYQP